MVNTKKYALKMLKWTVKRVILHMTIMCNLAISKTYQKVYKTSRLQSRNRLCIGKVDLAFRRIKFINSRDMTYITYFCRSSFIKLSVYQPALSDGYRLMHTDIWFPRSFIFGSIQWYLYPICSYRIVSSYFIWTKI